MLAQPIKAIRTYLTTRWWMPLVVYCGVVGGCMIAFIHVAQVDQRD